MATVKFIVKSSQKNQLATLYLRLIDGREIDLMVQSGYKIMPEYWNNKSQSFKQRIHYTISFTDKDRKKIETNLLNLKTAILQEYNKENQKSVSKKWLTEIIEYSRSGKKKSTLDDVNLNMFIDKFINEIESGQREYNHNNRVQRYKPLTIKNYKGFQSQFNQFQDENRQEVNFNDVTLDFYDGFIRFLNQKNYSPNTIGRHIKHLKSIMRAAREEGLHSNYEIEKKKFRIIKQETDSIYLTDQEIKEIGEVELNSKADDQARDVFLVGCYTAQRYSDYAYINENSIKVLDNDLKVIILYQQKTSEKVIIPIRKELMTILEKYNFNLPHVWQQKLNERIKNVAEKAKITQLVSVQSTKGGIVKKQEIPKNQLISSHTARRSGCTNMYLAGVPILDIMKISGHKSEKEFLNYIKVTKEETAMNLSRHPYFN